MRKTKVSESKKKEVEDIKRLIKEYKVIGIVNLEKLPAFNLMKIKSQLKGKILLKYSKKRLIKIAFDESNDENIKNLRDKLVGIPALIFTNEDPFKLFQLLKKSKSQASAKAGDIAPREIIIPAGPTEFTPGPMIGELGQMGIKTAVEGGKIVIKLDKLLVKEGEIINAKNAELMSKLKIEPMEIGLNLVLTYGNNEILVRSVLDIDVDKYSENIRLATGESLGLAMEIGYITNETIELLIKKAAIEYLGISGKVDLSQIKEETKIEDSIVKEEIKSGAKEAKKTVLERELEEKARFTEEIKEEVAIEQKDTTEITEDQMKQAGEILKNLVDKKIKGEI